MPSKLPQAIERIRAVSARDVAHLRSLDGTSKHCADCAIFCDAVVRYGVVDALQAYLRQPTTRTHGQLSSLLNMLLRHSASPIRDKSGAPTPSNDFGRAVIFALIALGCSDAPG